MTYLNCQETSEVLNCVTCTSLTLGFHGDKEPDSHQCYTVAAAGAIPHISKILIGKKGQEKNG